ncbi:MAG: helix-turn-helix transcriptional regulator, partial [Clostridia bacterium]|nr:helix-turn-helix transcriptional regulator [Clostridia bacterium]
MKISIGSKIRELRRRDSRTQEELANALGVTAQAVSRWESGGSYPDMEIVPAIANFFGVSIDELFGYHGEREAKVNALLAKVEELDMQNMREDATVDECIEVEVSYSYLFLQRSLLLLAENKQVACAKHTSTSTQQPLTKQFFLSYYRSLSLFHSKVLGLQRYCF